MTDEDEKPPSIQDQAINQAILETLRDGRALLGKLFGPAVSEFGGMLGDQMRFWRFRNLIRILSRVEEIVRDRGHEVEGLSTLGFGDAYQTIEAASFEEEDEVQELWARLIANAVSPDSSVTIKKVYVEILKSLSAGEAIFLELLGECERRSRWCNPGELKVFNEEMNELASQKWRRYDADAQKTVIQNLVRIRCIVFRPRPLNADRLLAEIPRELIQGNTNQWSLVDPRRFQEFITELANMTFTAVGVKDFDTSKPIPLQGRMGFGFGRALSVEVPEMNFMLTALGRDILNACESSKEAAESTK